MLFKFQAGRGSTAYKTFYFKKDIQFLLHEPIITNFRQNKVSVVALQTASGLARRYTCFVQDSFPSFLN